MSVDNSLAVWPAQTLNRQGQCCGRKPLVYKRQRMLFCARCDRQYDIYPPYAQQANWAYSRVDYGFCLVNPSLPWCPPEWRPKLGERRNIERRWERIKGESGWRVIETPVLYEEKAQWTISEQGRGK